MKFKSKTVNIRLDVSTFFSASSSKRLHSDNSLASKSDDRRRHPTTICAHWHHHRRWRWVGLQNVPSHPLLPPPPFVGWVMGCSSEAIECSRTCQTHPSAVGTENDNWVEAGHRQNKLICWHLLLANICVCSAAGKRVCCPMLGMMWWQTSGTRGPLNFSFILREFRMKREKKLSQKWKNILDLYELKEYFLCRSRSSITIKGETSCPLKDTISPKLFF